MRGRTMLARGILTANVVLWLGVPLVASLEERGELVRPLLALVAARPIETLLAPLAVAALGAALYPRPEPGAADLPILPMVSLAASWTGYVFLDHELAPNDVGGLFSCFGVVAVWVLATVLDRLLRRTRFASMIFAPIGALLGALVFGFFLSGIHGHRDEARAERIVEALAAHRRRTGAYPQRLEELVPHELDEVPRPGTWYWRGPHFLFNEYGLPRPAAARTGYRLGYVTPGDLGYGARVRSEGTEWTYVPKFDGTPRFDHPMPPRPDWLPR